MKKNKTLTVKKMSIVGVLSAISIVLGLTPLGFIPLGIAKATTMHIPVIIGGIVEGPLVGGLVGLIFGLFSVFQAITNPVPTSIVFYNPMVSILPRVLIGIVSYYSYNLLGKIVKNRKIRIGMSAVLGSLMNTFGVLSMIYIFHGKKFVELIGMSSKNIGRVIAGIGITNGIPEAILAAIIVIGVLSGLNNRE